MAYHLTPLEKPGDCTRCGTFAQFRNTAGECSDCHNLGYRERQAARKAQLAGLPRCEVDDCTRRGTWQVGHAAVRMCGRHKTAAVRSAHRQAAGLGALAFLAGSIHHDRESTIALAKGEQ